MVKGDENVEQTCRFTLTSVLTVRLGCANLILRVKGLVHLLLIPCHDLSLSYSGKIKIFFSPCLHRELRVVQQFSSTWLGLSCSKTFKQVGCLQSQGPETMPSSWRVVSLLTTPTCCLFNVIHWQGRQQYVEFVSLFVAPFLTSRSLVVCDIIML